MKEVKLNDAASVIETYEEYMESYQQAASKLLEFMKHPTNYDGFYFFKTKRFAHGGLSSDNAFLVVQFPNDSSLQYRVNVFPIEFWQDFEIKEHYTLEPRIPEPIFKAMESINIVKCFYERMMNKVVLVKM